MNSYFPFAVILFIIFGLSVCQAAYANTYDFDDESNDDYSIVRKRATAKPSWSPVFPGDRNDLDEESGHGIGGSDSEYISTYRPQPERTSKRTSWVPYPTTTTTEKIEVATKKLPWYRRFGNYAKTQYNYVKNKVG